MVYFDVAIRNQPIYARDSCSCFQVTSSFFFVYIDLMSLASFVSDLVTVSDDDEVDYSIKPEFYDSDLDDKDELWMVKKRDSRTSDALLSCPACFTTVCLECQR